VTEELLDEDECAELMARAIIRLPRKLRRRAWLVFQRRLVYRLGLIGLDPSEASAIAAVFHMKVGQMIAAAERVEA
jgi:hypothetical protein